MFAQLTIRFALHVVFFYFGSLLIIVAGNHATEEQTPDGKGAMDAALAAIMVAFPELLMAVAQNLPVIKK